jgi:hypothetical protein
VCTCVYVCACVCVYACIFICLLKKIFFSLSLPLSLSLPSSPSPLSISRSLALVLTRERCVCQQWWEYPEVKVLTVPLSLLCSCAKKVFYKDQTILNIKHLEITQNGIFKCKCVPSIPYLSVSYVLFLSSCSLARLAYLSHIA